MIKAQVAAQSLSSVKTSDEVFAGLPSGARVEKAEDKVIGWVDKYEKVLDKVIPAAN